MKSLLHLFAKSPDIDHGIISTESDDIAIEAGNFGLEVPFKRPFHLSGDFVGDLEIIQHALSNYARTVNFDYIMLLQPTCPLRKHNHIGQCLKKIKETNLDAVWTVSEVQKTFHPFKQLVITKNKLKYFCPEGMQIIARQQLGQSYIRNGACYIWRIDYITRSDALLLPPHSMPVIITDPLVNIDEEGDLKDAEELFIKTSGKI